MSADDYPPTSLSGLVATLAPVALTAGVYLTIFLILRRSKRRWYAPRTYLGSMREAERSPELPNGWFNWIPTFWKLPDTWALSHQSLDAYLFLRFLRLTVVISLVGCIVTWPILFPVNATGGGSGQQLDILAFSNVNTTNKANKNRFYAHTFVAWIFYGFVMYLIARECVFYINLRQAFLLSPVYANRISSRTVLFTSVPAPYLDEAKLRKVFGDSVKQIWITGETEDLEKLVEERDKVAFTLEKAEVNLIKTANGERLKAIKNGATPEESAAAADGGESGELAARWIPQKKRPTHRTGKFGLVGPKVDSIDWCRTRLETLIPETDAAQAKYLAGEYNKVGGVFIEFFTQSQAQVAFQVLSHHQALHMSPRYIGVHPEEVVWKALRISWWQKVVRRYAVLGFITALIVFWAIPVAVVGTISNVSYLETISFLTWLKKIPTVIMGVVSGLLPSVALSILMSLVPVIMRLCAKLSGEPSLSRVELFTQNAYFAFQVVQVFLVTTCASSAAAVGKQIAQDPGSATSLLATNLPRASNFYISYFIVQGLGIAANVLCQVIGFVIFSLLYRFLAGTPRAMYQKWATLSAISWGSVLPVYTMITVIALTYAAIAPLMLGFSTIGMFLFYLAYRYNILFVTDTVIDTHGLIYPRALKQLFTGLYLGEICMIGLFAISTAIGPLVLMVAFLVFTVLFQVSVMDAFSPLLYNLPLSLEVEEESFRAELASSATLEKNVSKADGGEPSNNGHKAVVEKDLGPAPHAKPSLFAKFFKPHIYCDFQTLRRLVPHDLVDAENLYTAEIERAAYYPPAVTSATPLLWIPRDEAGISQQEVAHTSKVIAITDEGCTINEKNKLVWDTETVRPPIWDEKVYY